ERLVTIEMKGAQYCRRERLGHRGRKPSPDRRARPLGRRTTPACVQRFVRRSRKEIDREADGALLESCARPVTRRIEHDRSAGAEMSPEQCARETGRDGIID